MAHSSWGPGWPDCQSGNIVDLNVDGTVFPAGVRAEIHELTTRLVRETRNRGYQFGNDDDPSYGCWGFNCRCISGTSTPSNHSWGLAVDINAPSNPYKYPPVVTDMPDWMPDLWNAYGFRWGGDYSSGKVDAMHYEFMGSAQDAANYTELARANRLGESGPPTKEVEVGDLISGHTPLVRYLQQTSTFIVTPDGRLLHHFIPDGQGWVSEVLDTGWEPDYPISVMVPPTAPHNLIVVHGTDKSDHSILRIAQYAPGGKWAFDRRVAP